jgi:YHS domain-containing protein
MGKPVAHVHEGQEVQFCCKSCKPKFDKDPAKYLSKLTK